MAGMQDRIMLLDPLVSARIAADELQRQAEELETMLFLLRQADERKAA